MCMYKMLTVPSVYWVLLQLQGMHTAPHRLQLSPDLLPVSLKLENVVHAGGLSNSSTFQQGAVFGVSAALRELKLLYVVFQSCCLCFCLHSICFN